MSRLLCTDQVRVTEITPALAVILHELERAAREIGVPSVIYVTAVHNGTHMKGSRHYTNEAVDCFTAHGVAWPDVQSFIAQLQMALGSKFVVLHESAGTPNSHLHIQPRRGTVYP